MMESSPAPRSARAREWRFWRDLAVTVAIGGALIALVAGTLRFATHVIAPRFLTHHEHFPALAAVPTRTMDASRRPADPVNVAIVGSEAEVRAAFAAAGWREAQPVNRATSIGIAKSVLLDRPDSAAPVSPLFLFGRAQDLAFEREVGRSARQRHHVRLWQVQGITDAGRPVWIGGATFDLRAGLSHRTLHPTHHIAPDVDEERETVLADLARAGQAAATFRVTGMGTRVDAHNAEEDRFDTDGELRVIAIPAGNAHAPPPVDSGVPALVALKDRLWALAHRR